MTDDRTILQLTRLRPRTLEPTCLLGPWCASDGNGATRIATAPAERIDSDAVREQLAGAYTTAMAQVADWLCEVHGLDRDVAYWEMACYRAVTTLVREFFLRDRYLTAALRVDPDMVPATLHPGDFVAPSTDAELAAWYEASDLFNLQLFSLAASELAPQRVTFRASEFHGTAADPASHGSGRGVHGLRGGLGWLRSLMRGGHVPVGVNSIGLFPTHFPAPFEKRLAAASGYRLEPVRVPGRDTASNGVDRELRQSLMPTAAGDPWTYRLLTAIGQCLPRNCVEDFHRHRRVADRMARRGRPALIVGAYFRGMPERLWISESRRADAGSRLVMVQHGGGYGEAAGPFVRWGDVEARLADTFVSWGWGQAEPGIAPLPAPRLLKTVSGSRTPGDAILFVSGPVRRYPTLDHFLAVPLPDETQARFWGELPPGLRRRGIFRGHPRFAGVPDMQATWRDQYPDIEIDLGEVDMLERIAAARIVVIGYPFSTTFLECLALDKPALVLSDGRDPDASPRARPFYRRLAECGVVQTDAVSAARAVAEAYDDAEAWWGEPTRRTAVEAFAHEFARVGPDPLAEWSAFLRRELGAEAG